MKYFIYSTWWKSGGPEALHQLCSAINDLGGDAYMIYENGSKVIFPEYAHYNVKCAVEGFSDSEDNVLIIPECVNVDGLGNIIRSKIVYWWLSLDRRWNPENPNFDRVYHGCQSNYVVNHLQPHIDPSRIFNLTDYTKQSFIVDEDLLRRKNGNRENIVLFNPLKGYEITQRLEKECEGMGIRFIPLKDMTPSQIQDISYRAKVYIDFGGHPGKDRIPREMASSGCSVIVGKRGSAINEVDVPIKSKFDYDEATNSIDYAAVRNQIEHDMHNFNDAFEEMHSYREQIRRERETFYGEVSHMMRMLG